MTSNFPKGGATFTKNPEHILSALAGQCSDTGSSTVTAEDVNKRRDRPRKRTPKFKARTTKTYFIHDAALGLVKIGRTVNVGQRFSTLNAEAAPRRLTLLGWMDGDFEAEVHRHFREIRESGEWFRLTPELAEFIANASEEPVAPPFHPWKYHGAEGPSRAEIDAYCDAEIGKINPHLPPGSRPAYLCRRESVAVALPYGGVA